MTISAVSASANAYLSTVQAGFSQRKADFQALTTALGSGDLSAAQKAFAAFIQGMQGAGRGQAPGGGSSDPRGSLATDLQALGSALQSGDLAGAQKAFATLQQDLQKVHGRHHHHHHHAASTTDAAATSTGSIDIQG